MKRRTALSTILLLAAAAAADTAPLGALRSSTPVVTNETDSAWLEWQTNSTAILLGSGASNRAGGGAIPWITRDISIGAGAESCESVSIGWGATSGVYSAAVGPDTYAGRHAAAIGDGARAADDSIAIGHAALAAAPGSIQIGEGRNADGGTVQVFDWQLLDSRGIIPPARLGSVPMRARLFSGSAVVVDPTVSLYWCTNLVMSGAGFPVSVSLPDDADALRFDLWLTAGSTGLAPALIPGVIWAGPVGPPAAWAPGDTVMLGCTAVRSASGDTLVVAEYGGAVPALPSGAIPAPSRAPGSVRAVAVPGPFVQADGSADIYTMSLSSSSAWAVAASIPAGSGGIAGEVWISNSGSSSITPTCGNTFIGEAPAIPAGGSAVFRFRSLPAGPHTVETVVTLEGVTPAGRGAKGGGEEEEEPEDEPKEEEPSEEEEPPGGGEAER